MKWMRTAILISLLCPVLAWGQAAPITGFCVNGAKQAITNGLASSNYNQNLIPRCKVTVFLAGTTTFPPAIYSDSHQTPLTNPFTANTDGSWTFYVPIPGNGVPFQVYDVMLSDGVPPNTYTAPRTITNQALSGASISGAFVLKAGDTMSGNLKIQPAGGTAAGLTLHTTTGGGPAENGSGIAFTDDRAGTNLKSWLFGSFDDGSFHLIMANDAATASNDALFCNRTDFTLASCTFAGPLTIAPLSAPAVLNLKTATGAGVGIAMTAGQAGADQKVWAINTTNDGKFHVVAANDAGTVGNDAITCTRNGATPTGCSFPGGASSRNSNGNWQVAGYGAVGDGVLAPTAMGSTATYSGTDNTAAFNNAIKDACAAGGGEVDIPGGIFNVSTTPGAPRQTGLTSFTNIAAIYIPCNNITIKGAGINQTFISVWMNNGGKYERVTDECPANPDFTPANPAFTFPRTWRGSGIYIAAQDIPGAVTSNIQIRDLSLIGNAVINGNNANPVRQDATVPLPPYSQCNAWDTSNKGIYFQNNIFGPNPTNGAFYPNCNNCKYSNIVIDHVKMTNFLGEIIYTGNQAGITLTNSELGQTNGDAVSVGGALTEINNNIHDCWANGNENSTMVGSQIYQGNQFSNILLDGIGEINSTLAATAQYPNHPQVTINNNTFYKNARSAIHAFSPIHVQITNNQIVDSGWSTFNTAPISLLGQFNPQTATWTPPAPAATTPTSSGGGSINTGTYFVAESWYVPATYTVAQSAVSTCISITVGASSTITIPAPTPAPANAAGWYAFIGTSCTPAALFVQNGNVPNALGTSATVSTLAVSGATASATGVVYTPGIGDTDIVDNMIIADQASNSSGIQLTRLGAGLMSIGLSNVTNHGNHFNNTLANTSTVVAAPANIPIVTNVPGPPYTYAPQPVLPAGTYYVKYSWLTPECETAPSPETSISVGAGQQLNVTPNPADTPPPNVYGFYTLMSMTSGTETRQNNRAQDLTIPNSTFLQQYQLTSGNAPSTGSACNGTNFSQAVTTAFNTTNSTGYTEYALAGNALTNGATELQTFIGGATPVNTTSTTTIASYRPSHIRWATASVNYQVINAPTLVVIQLIWVDYANAQHFLTIENATAQPVGLYQIDPIDVPVGAQQPTTMTVRAGTAGNVLINGQITDKGVN